MDGNQATGAVTVLGDFDAVFREHFAAVYRFLARRVGRALAEDLADQGSTSTPIYTNHG